LIINVVYIYIITVNKKNSEEQNKKLKTKQTRLYAKSLMSTKEIMDFKKKEAIRSKEYRKKQLLIKNKDKIMTVEVINLKNESMNLQNLNLVTEIQGEINDHDTRKGNLVYKQNTIILIITKNYFNNRNTRNYYTYR